MHQLKAVSLKSLPVGKHEDGAGLRLIKRKQNSGQWVFRYTFLGKRREMGLGGYPALSLANARSAATQARSLVAQGIDPIEDRKRSTLEASGGPHLLEDLAQEAFESHKASLKGDGKAGRWFSPLELHILPKLGKRSVEQLTATDIEQALSPIWHKKASTAMKAAERLGLVLKHAAARGLQVDMQAALKAKALLGVQRHAISHIPSMPWEAVPRFYASLRDQSPTQLALRFLILTGQRSYPVRFAHLDEIDGDAWTIPGEKMKGPRGKTPDFRVPLSQEALRVVDLARPLARDGYLFASRKSVISDTAMLSLMKRAGYEERPHGFRSSLRTWLAECTDAPHEVAEAVLSHVSDSKVVRTYRRTDFFSSRKRYLEMWAQHCLGEGQ